MAWDDTRGLGAIVVPDPKSIHPRINRVNMFGSYMLKPGFYHKGDVVVIKDRKVYDQFIAAGWEPADSVP